MSESLRELHRELQSRQKRLGTAAEMAEDFDRVLHLAHAINNQITAEYLRSTCEAESDNTPTLFAVCKAVLRRS